MIEIKAFLVANHLKREDLEKYLGVSGATVSNWCKGHVVPKPESIQKIIDNEFGWDTSMLVDKKPIVETHASGSSNVRVAINSHNKSESIKEIESLKERIADLEKQLEEEKGRSAQYWEMIQSLIKK